jgi:hypothetical protein
MKTMSTIYRYQTGEEVTAEELRNAEAFNCKG